MEIEASTVRLLGAAQLLVFLASMISEQLLASVVGSSTGTDILQKVSENLTRMRVSNLVAMINCLAILVLGVLFYHLLEGENRTIALVALVCFVAEAITLAASKIGSYALIPLSQEFVEADASGSSRLADLLYHGVDRRGYDIHMLFFCLGALLWYLLLHSSGYVPQALSIWGVAAVGLLSVPTLLVLYDSNLFPGLMILALPYAPYELVLGLWLAVKGFN